MTVPLNPSFFECARGFGQLDDGQGFVPGRTLQFDVPTDALIEGFDIKLSGDVVLDEDPANVGTARDHNPVELFTNIRVKIGSVGEKKNGDGLGFYIKSWMRDGNPCVRDALTDAEAGADGTYNISCSVPVDMSSLGVSPAELGTLLASEQRSVTVYVTCGDIDNLVDDGTYTSYDLTGLTVSVSRRLLYPAEYDVRGYGQHIEDMHDEAIAAAGDVRFKLTPYRLYRDMTIVVMAGDPLVLSDAILDNVKVRLESATFPFDASALAIRNRMVKLHGVRSDIADAPLTGIYHVDFGKSHIGMPSLARAGLDALNASEVTAILTVLGACHVWVHTTYWED